MGSQKVDMNVVPPKIISIYLFIFSEVAESWKINPKKYQYRYKEKEEGHPSNDISSVNLLDIEGRVRSLEEIFKSLHLSSNGCKNMLVCLLAKNQEKFSPMSQLVLDLLKVDKTLVTQYELLYDLERRNKEMEKTVLYLNLLEAVRSGSQGYCHKYSTVCDYKGEAMITEDRILAWKLNLMMIDLD